MVPMVRENRRKNQNKSGNFTFQNQSKLEGQVKSQNLKVPGCKS